MKYINNDKGKIKSLLWRDKYLSGLDFNETQYRTHRFRPHFHEHYVIQLVERGVNVGVCERKHYQIKVGEIIIINPSEIHTGNSWNDQVLAYKSLYPTIDFVDSFFQKMQISKNEIPFFVNTPVFDKYLNKKFRQLFLLTKNKNDRLEIETAGVEFFGYLFEKYAGTLHLDFSRKNEKCRTKKIKEFITENYDRNFSLEELSKYANISSYHLIRVFRKEVGMTPFDYLRNFRIEKAKELLRKNKSMMDAIFDTGFYDQSHFIRHFKNITGVTPKAYC